MSSHKPKGLESKITAAKKKNNDTVGKIEWLYSGTSMRYTDAAEFVKAYKDNIDIYGISGVNVKVTAGNPELAYEICVIQYNEFGEQPPTKEEFYLKYKELTGNDSIVR